MRFICPFPMLYLDIYWFWYISIIILVIIIIEWDLLRCCFTRFSLSLILAHNILFTFHAQNTHTLDEFRSSICLFVMLVLVKNGYRRMCLCLILSRMYRFHSVAFITGNSHFPSIRNQSDTMPIGHNQINNNADSFKTIKWSVHTSFTPHTCIQIGIVGS